MILELSEEYIPKEVLHRKKQILAIKELFINFKKWGMGTNLLVLGVTGSGKTLILKKVIEDEDNSIYVSCVDKTTAYKTLREICGVHLKDVSDVLNKTIEKLKQNPKIMIIDEIDKVKDLNNLMDYLNAIYRKTMIPIIIITMKRDILKGMPEDARKTLFFERVGLPAYNASELKDILISRLEQIEIKPKIKVGTLNYISAIASRHGSARVLMNILLRCFQKNNFDTDFIDKVYKEMMKQEWFGFVEDINETEKEFLKYLLDLCDYSKEVDAKTLQKKIGFSQPRTSQLINTFEKYSAITSRHENLGRAGGRRRFIKFASKEIYEELNKMVGKR